MKRTTFFVAGPARAVLIMMVATVGGAAARADALDAYVAREMASQHVPGLSLAVIDHG